MSTMNQHQGSDATTGTKDRQERRRQERRETMQRAERLVAACAKARFAAPDALEASRRLARAEAFAATPRGRRLLAARARTA